jgi:hypothetical protein
MGVVKFCCPADAGAALGYDVNLALITTSERSINGIFARDHALGLKIKPLDLR